MPCDFRQAGGHAAMLRLLNLRHPPTAVLVANNLMTLGALQAIHERTLHIPDDLAVVCFDDMPWATALWPPLTAIAQPALEIGRVAAEMLLTRLREPDRPVRTVSLATRVIVRASSGPHRKVSRAARPPAARSPQTLNPTQTL